eukprot:CAMPEP_0185040590 /NCGR_PEP_ID=MMETSP1103-20130426/38819_1 /TAXON_ID=36769 /ORGANISM="Paraphysomonas bandaiensis, Strain Caron Lab Isolate" /LENGTH=1588 /DNA_ID=CAMNT_0027579955 /DNA_START=83 /DNA_END=4849 /DNA_ORIENTATION=-
MTKLGSRTWSEPGLQPVSTNAVSGFQKDATSARVTNSVGDLLQLTRERAARQFVDDSITKSASSANVQPKKSNRFGSSKGGGDFGGIQSAHIKYQNVHERPPRRVEVSHLENELTQMVKTVMQPLSDDVIYQPHKEKMMLVQNRILDELKVDPANAYQEPWLDSVVKSECLKDLCDEVGLRLTDMLSVSSAELGNVLRKLRYTYDQSFLQLLESWKEVRAKYVEVERELQETQVQVRSLHDRIDQRDFDIREQIELEVEEIKKDFEYEREQDKEKIRMHEQQMDQMNSTLKNLNAIFKTMQSDVDAARSADTFARCSRLEREVTELEAQVASAEKIKKELDEEREKSSNLECHRDRQIVEIESLKAQLARRDTTIAELMERETLRNAEIEKLTRMAAQRQENDDDLDLDPVASSVLCIKCKKSLDDISSIRDAILGKNNATGKDQKLSCQSFRILLPNNKGKKPHRTNAWLKACMRCILTSKMSETLSLLPIGENVSSFPSFVYAWFESGVDSPMQQQLSDDNRWGFYYGVKTLAKDNAEAKLFWGLLDEVQGDDGLVFVCHCLSVVLSIAGSQLWKQFGSTMNRASIPSHFDDSASNATIESTPPSIWLEIETAYAAVKLILVRALESQIVETLDAIDSLKTVPEVPDTMADNSAELEGNHKHTENDVATDTSATEVTSTHIDLFTWLRVMLQRFQDEQCHRHAAVRLMFDTASMGALTGSVNCSQSGTAEAVMGQYDSENPQVYFPQFTAVVKTLYPFMSLAEIAELYSVCYREGDGRVTASVFTEIAEQRHLFSKSLKLGPLPLFQHENICNSDNAEESQVSGLFDPGQNNRLRSQIGSLVHQRYALLSKEIDNLVKTMPSRWKALVTDASDSVRTSLQEYFVVMKSRKRGGGLPTATTAGTVTTSDGSMVPASTGRLNRSSSTGDCSRGNHRFIDGLQPFIQYHRLLSIVLMVKSFSENTLLPVSFLCDDKSSRDLTGEEPAVQLRAVSIKKVDKLLSTMEESIFLHSLKQDSFRRYFRFKQCQKNVFARKIQNSFRNFLSYDCTIPRSLRYHISSGYLSGKKTKDSSVLPLKLRRVFLEPWTSQFIVASTYMFKLTYDSKAYRRGLSTISLSAATSSLLLSLFSSVEVVERVMQDLCLGIQTYMHGCPRLRMFAAFLGFGELEEPVASVFQKEIFLSAYLELIHTIHREVSRGENEVSEFREVPILFPCSEDPASRLDKRDVWLLPMHVLSTAVYDWASNFKGLKEGIWDSALSRVKRNKDDCAEVDDFLWVMMQVLAKGLSGRLRKCDDSAKDYVVKKVQPNNNAVVSSEGDKTVKRSASSIISDHLADEQKIQKLKFPHSPSTFLLHQSINSMHGRAVQDDENLKSLETDTQQCCVRFSHLNTAHRFCNYFIHSRLLQDCMTWDTFAFSHTSSVLSDSNVSTSLSYADYKYLTRIISAVPPALSLRFFQQWWLTNKDNLSKEVAQMEVEMERNEGQGKLSRVSEIERMLDVVKKYHTRLDQIMADSSPSSIHSGFGDVAANAQDFAYADEVWRTASSMLGSLALCLKLCGREMPRDAWKAGRKLHLDRASAYLMQVQPNLR